MHVLYCIQEAANDSGSKICTAVPALAACPCKLPSLSANHSPSPPCKMGKTPIRVNPLVYSFCGEYSSTVAVYRKRAWARIYKFLRSSEIDSKASIPPANVAWRSGRYPPIPSWFLPPIECLKIPALNTFATEWFGTHWRRVLHILQRRSYDLCPVYINSLSFVGWGRKQDAGPEAGVLDDRSHASPLGYIGWTGFQPM